MEQLIQTIPLIIAIVVPPIFALVKSKLGGLIPDRYVPVILPIGGGIVAGIASLVGVDASVLATISQDAETWQTVITGVLTGAASVGIHQVKRQVVDKPKEEGGGS